MASASSSSRGDGAAQPVDQATELLNEVRRLRHYPKESKANPSESKLARKLREARKNKKFSPAQLQELDQLNIGALQPDDDPAECLLNEVRQLGHYPKDTKDRSAERLTVNL